MAEKNTDTFNADGSLDFYCEKDLKKCFVALCDKKGVVFSDAVRNMILECVRVGKMPEEMAQAWLEECLQLNKAADCKWRTNGVLNKNVERCRVRVNSAVKEQFREILDKDPSRLKANKIIRLYIRMCVKKRKLFY